MSVILQLDPSWTKRGSAGTTIIPAAQEDHFNPPDDLENQASGEQNEIPVERIKKRHSFSEYRLIFQE